MTGYKKAPKPTPKGANQVPKDNHGPWGSPMGNKGVSPGGSHDKKGATGIYLGGSDATEKGTGKEPPFWPA